jgi:uncharacterized protein involved in exopolysaccharide biosynthesis
LEKMEQDLRSAIAFSENAAADARRRLGTRTSADTLISQQRIRLNELENQLTDLDLEIRVAEQRIRHMSDDGPGSRPAEVDAGGEGLIYYRDPGWLRLKEECDVAEQRLAEHDLQHKDPDDARALLESRLQFARRQLADHERVLRELAMAGLRVAQFPEDNEDTLQVISLSGLKKRLPELQVRRSLLQETVERLRQQYASDFHAAETLREETQKAQQLRERLQQVQQRIRELREKQRVPPSVRVIEEAVPATHPENAGARRNWIVVAVLGSIGLGLVCSLVRCAGRPPRADTVPDRGDAG